MTTNRIESAATTVLVVLLLLFFLAPVYLSHARSLPGAPTATTVFGQTAQVAPSATTPH